MSATSVLQTPPASPRPLEGEEHDSITNALCKPDDALHNDTGTPHTPPSTPSHACQDDALHVAENGKSASNATPDHQADPHSECTEGGTEALLTDANVRDLAFSLTPQPTPSPQDGDNEDKSVGIPLVVATGNVQSERTIAKGKEVDPGPSESTTDNATRLEDTTASLSVEPLEPSESEQTEADYAPAALAIHRPLEKPDEFEKVSIKISRSKAIAKEPKVSSHAAEAQRSPQLVRDIKPGYDSAQKNNGHPRCQGTTLKRLQCKWDSNCTYHPGSNTYTPVEEARANHKPYLCKGVTKANALCERSARSCEYHRDDRILTKGDIFRKHLSTLTFTRASKKLYFIATREVEIVLEEGWSASPELPNFQRQLESEDLHPNTEFEMSEKVRVCIDSFVQRMHEITSDYGKYIKQSIFHAISQHFAELRQTESFSRKDEVKLRPFATAYVYFTIYTPSKFQYYDKNFISNHCVVIKNGVSRNVEKRFKGQEGQEGQKGYGGHEKKCGINPKNRRSFPDETIDGVPFGWLLESVLHCFCRAHQYTFQCGRSTCDTRHEEMFLYKLLSGENQVAAFHAVVDHVASEFRMDDWIQALRILKPLQQFYEQLVDIPTHPMSTRTTRR